MTANAFGIACCTVSVIVRKVCDVIARVLGPKYIKLPSTEQQMKKYPHAHTNEVIFNNMFRSARNPIECAFDRRKANANFEQKN